MKLKVFSLTFASLFFVACANHAASNKNFESEMVSNVCSPESFAKNMQKLEKNDDVIYTGINAGLVARNCGDFNASNVFFDKAEEAYKWDVDLQNIGKKGAKLAATTLINDTIVDYEGSLYERIMVNVYKGLNYMSLEKSEDARVEFNRALMRQDKAKEYFANEIAKARAEEEKAKEDKNYEKNMGDNTKTIHKEYDHLFTEFNTAKNFVNPYATYISSLFFFMEKDYRKANDLFREVAVINPKNKELENEFKVIKQRATKAMIKNPKNYVFVVYENGFGVEKDDFKLTLPIYLGDGKLVSSSIALQTLKKRDSSFEYIKANGTESTQLVNLDDIVATEFKINMPSMVAKAIAQTIVKTTLNAVVANNDSTGGWLTLASSVATALTNAADVRSWKGLPKSVSVAMIENTGSLEITDPNSNVLYIGELDKNKNAIVLVRSFSPSLPANVKVVQK